jgi:hypothetical protein
MKSELEVFYDTVAELLETQHPFKELKLYMSRWGDRTPGNGRFPGHGLVRVFSPTVIHVALYEPKLYGAFTSFDTALEALRLALAIP